MYELNLQHIGLYFQVGFLTVSHLSSQLNWTHLSVVFGMQQIHFPDIGVKPEIGTIVVFMQNENQNK